MANQDLRESVLLNLRSVTQSCKGGVPFERLQRDYQDLLGEPIPYRKLGYDTLEAFIRDIPDVISLIKNHEGQLMAEGVANASTAHIVSLVSRQKSAAKKKNFRKPPSRNRMRRPVLSGFPSRERPRNAHSGQPLLPHPNLQSSRVPHWEESRSGHYPHPTPSHPPPPPLSSRFPSWEGLRSSHSRYTVLPHPSLQSSSVPYWEEPRSGHYPYPSSLHHLPLSSRLPSWEEPRNGHNHFSSPARKSLKNKPSILPVPEQHSKPHASSNQMPRKYKKAKRHKNQAKINVSQELIPSSTPKLMTMLPETSYGSEEEIEILLNRIEEIICEKTTGMFAKGILQEYRNKFNENLPSCWPDLIKKSCYMEIENLDSKYDRVPEGANFIVRPTKALSSGNRTPSSTSSKNDFVSEDLDIKTLREALASISANKISEIKIPEIKIPNSNIWDVLITNVSGWFSVRLLDYENEFLLLSKEMDQFYKTRSFPVVDVHKFQLYAACLDENPDIWHRVLVEEVKDDDQITCYFVDEGDFTYVKKKNLQEMKKRFTDLPYQAIQLSLEGLEKYDSCITDEVLEEHLLGKALIAEVKKCYSSPDFFKDVPGIHRTVYTVILYNTSGSEDVNLNELLRKSAKHTVREMLICKLPKRSTSSCVYLSYATADGRVYLRFSNPHSCWIEQELDRLSSVFEEASAALPKIPLGTFCAAKHESGTWYRAVVCENGSVDPELIDVFFVDYGDLSVVKRSKICALQPISEMLASLPYQAICCELQDALPTPNSQWTEAGIAKLYELAPFGQELIVRVMCEEEETTLAKVNLYKRNKDNDIISINDSLACNPALFKEMSVPELRNKLSNDIPDVAVSAEEEMARRLLASVSEEFLQLPVIPDVGLQFDVFVTMAAHPHNFVVQPLASWNELDILVNDMQNFYSCKDNLCKMDFNMLRKNGYYAALHSDNLWYRVRIEETMSSSIVTVPAYYIDFGDLNNVSIDKLQPLYQRFKHLPCQAIKASLTGIKPYDTDWNPMHCEKFREMITEKRFVSRICKKELKRKDGIPDLRVELILIDTNDKLEDIYIDKLLVEKHMAKYS